MKSELFKVAETKELKQEVIKFTDSAKISQIKALVYNPLILKV